MTDEEEMNALKSEWLRHEFTEIQLRHLMDYRRKAFDRLKRACDVTTDVKVANAYQTYQMFNNQVLFFGGKNDK
jgi:hypothetical protein